MRHKIALIGGLLLLTVAQIAIAQQEKVVPFQEHDEELQGTIYMTEPESGLLILEKNSIRYSFKITPASHIVVNSQPGNLESLVARKGQRATVRFRVTRNGNIIQEIAVSSAPAMTSQQERMAMPCPMMGTDPMPPGCPHRE
jgi:hypothetical protein